MHKKFRGVVEQAQQANKAARTIQRAQRRHKLMGAVEQALAANNKAFRNYINTINDYQIKTIGSNKINGFIKRVAKLFSNKRFIEVGNNKVMKLPGKDKFKKDYIVKDGQGFFNPKTFGKKMNKAGVEAFFKNYYDLNITATELKGRSKGVFSIKEPRGEHNRVLKIEDPKKKEEAERLAAERRQKLPILTHPRHRPPNSMPTEEQVRKEANKRQRGKTPTRNPTVKVQSGKGPPRATAKETFLQKLEREQREKQAEKLKRTMNVPRGPPTPTPRSHPLNRGNGNSSNSEESVIPRKDPPVVPGKTMTNSEYFTPNEGSNKSNGNLSNGSVSSLQSFKTTKGSISPGPPVGNVETLQERGKKLRRKRSRRP